MTSTWDTGTYGSGFGGSPTFTNGNRTFQSDEATHEPQDGFVSSTAVVAAASGKATIEASGNFASGDIGLVIIDGTSTQFFATQYLGANTWQLLSIDGLISTGVVAASGNDVISIDTDFTAKTAQMRVNNTVVGTPGSFTTSFAANVAVGGLSGNNVAITSNFDAGQLAYSPPSGYVSWDAFAAGGGPVDITGTMAATVPAPVVAITAVETPVWSLVGISEVAVDASGDYTLSEPGSVAQYDVLVAAFAIRSNVLHANADWLPAQSDASGNTTNNTTGSIVSYQAFYCFRGASPPSYVFTKTGGSRSLGTVAAWRSNRPGLPSFDTSAELAMGSTGTGLTLSGGLTTAEADELLVSMVALARASSTTAQCSAMDGATEVTGNSGAIDTTIAPVLNTWTERSDRGNTTSPTVALALYDTVKQSAGSTGNLTATAAKSARHGMVVLAFKHPALAGASIIPAIVHHRKMQGMQ